jgi:hypothetical protein
MTGQGEWFATAETFSSIITPYLPLIGIIVGGIIVGGFGVWNRRRGATETRAPDVNEIWQQQIIQSHELDMERKWRRRLENYSHELKRVFIGYVRRVLAGGSTELTHHEKVFYDSDPPTSEINIKNN